MQTPSTSGLQSAPTGDELVLISASRAKSALKNDLGTTTYSDLPYKKLLLRQKLVWLKRTEGINMALQNKNRQIIAVAIKAVIIKTSQIYLKIRKITITQL